MESTQVASFEFNCLLWEWGFPRSSLTCKEAESNKDKDQIYSEMFLLSVYVFDFCHM